MKATRLVFAALLLCAVPAAVARTSFTEPRAISAAERAATEVVSAFLAEGPEAIRAALSADAPWRALPQNEARAEIEARTGQPDREVWALQAIVPSLSDRYALFSVRFSSGADDGVLFEMVQERGVWKVRSVRTLSEPPPAGSLLPPDAIPSPPPAAASVWSDRATRLPLLPAALVAVVALALAAARPRTARAFAVVAVAGVAASVVFVAVRGVAQHAPKPQPPARPTATKPSGEQLRLGRLVPLRAALATGDATAVGRSGELPSGVADTAAVWESELLFDAGRFDDAKRVLNRTTVASPFGELMRARIARSDARDLDAVSAYERAIDLGPGRDGLWLEAAEAFANAGFDERADKLMDRLCDVGSRDASAYYLLAISSAIAQDDYLASKAFLRAWQMRPVERSRVVSTAPFWRLVRDAAISKQLALHAFEEATFAATATAPIAVAPGTMAEVSGEYLRLRSGSAELQVPGGARIAPAGATVRDAGFWRREEEESALAQLDALRARAVAASLANPELRRRCIIAAVTLASRNRWEDVVRLTDSLAAIDERSPLALLVLRGQAFARLRRRDEMRVLLVDLLRNPVVKRKRDPEALAAVGEMLASLEMYDDAVRMFDRARGQMELPGLDQRIEEIALEKKLASSYSRFSTQHFEIRYPNETPERNAQKVADILEKELARIRARWIAGPDLPRTIVNLLSFDDLRTYTGSEYIAGLYTDKIFLPLAEIDEFPPEVVAIITHELAHAVIADASENYAPRWFHEALASRIEMKDHSTNAFQTYRDERFLSVALLDSVTGGSPDPHLIREGYEVGESTLRFIEARFGRGAIVRMIREFRSGADTPAAVRAATGLTIGELDRQAREWGAKTDPVFAGGELVRYDGGEKKGTISGREEDPWR